jgi:hypothetical protein
MEKRIEEDGRVYIPDESWSVVQKVCEIGFIYTAKQIFNH